MKKQWLANVKKLPDNSLYQIKQTVLTVPMQKIISLHCNGFIVKVIKLIIWLRVQPKCKHTIPKNNTFNPIKFRKRINDNRMNVTNFKMCKIRKLV